MIKKDEIEHKSKEFEIHIANIERDYVNGWLLAGIYTISSLKDILVLKGGNCLRKGYFPDTRYTSDLDFSIESSIDETFLKQELNKVCDYVQDNAGVIFDKDRNTVDEKRWIDKERRIYEARLYFKDFYGNPDKITISIRLDITEFDKIYLPIQSRHLIHPYSDVEGCRAQIKCVQLEEILATKLKCILQRRHSVDLYDFVYSIFINKALDVKTLDIASVFLKKTIFEPSPGVVKNLLLGLPFEVFRGIWHKYLVCPSKSIINFDVAIDYFKKAVERLFGHFPLDHRARRFFPAHYRNIILEAGSGLTLLRVIYNNVERIVEPYSLVYKRRQDGVGQEYFYVYDRTRQGIRCFLHEKIQLIKNTNEEFEPQFSVELSKMGEFGDRQYFGKSFSRSHVTSKRRKPYSFRYGFEIFYIIQCPYCLKEFKRSKFSTTLRKHKDQFGNQCYSRRGVLLRQDYS